MSRHPAAIWAAAQEFSPEHVDCTTAVMLKILDGKCKMLPAAQNALMAMYSEICDRRGEHFGANVHRIIAMAQSSSTSQLSELVHVLRVRAETLIPKPRMKLYKAMLSEAFQSMNL